MLKSALRVVAILSAFAFVMSLTITLLYILPFIIYTLFVAAGVTLLVICVIADRETSRKLKEAEKEKPQ